MRRLESDIDNSTLKKVAAWLINEPVKSANRRTPPAKYSVIARIVPN